MVFGKRRKQFSLTRDVVVHGYDNGRLDLVDHFHDVFEAEIGHRVDRGEHYIDFLHYLFLLGSKEMSDIAKVSETKASHFIDKDGVGDRAPTLSPLAGNIYDRYVFHTRSYGILSLSEGNPSQDHGIAGHCACIVMSKVVIAHSDRVSLNTRCDVEIGVRDHFGLTAGMDQKTGMTIPLDEIVTQ